MQIISKDDLVKVLADHRAWRSSGGASGARADLADANLAGADLADAGLADANLAGAYLAGANLAGANLADADLAGAYLAGAKNMPVIPAVSSEAAVGAPVETVAPRPRLTREEWEAKRAKTAAERAQRYRERHPEVPIVENLDARILAVVEAGEGRLEMGSWHACDTTHCRAGWAIHLAGDAGYALEKKTGDPAIAGRMIYQASTGRVPHFYATNERALEDIKRCAAEQTAPGALSA